MAVEKRLLLARPDHLVRTNQPRFPAGFAGMADLLPCGALPTRGQGAGQCAFHHRPTEDYRLDAMFDRASTFLVLGEHEFGAIGLQQAALQAQRSDFS